MELNETIVILGKEYSARLNRDSVVTIEKYTNLQETLKKIKQNPLKYKNSIEENEDPFSNIEENEDLLNALLEQEATMKDIFSKAFWIWFHPNHKFNIKEVRDIIDKIYESDSVEEVNNLVDSYEKFMLKSTEIRQKYTIEQKKLRTQANK